MSRHKIVKNLDLDDELDDFNGGEDDYEEEGEGMSSITVILIGHVLTIVRLQNSQTKTAVRLFRATRHRAVHMNSADRSRTITPGHDRGSKSPR